MSRPNFLDPAVIQHALDVYQRDGATAAARAVGVTTRTVFRWAREAGVSSGWQQPEATANHGTVTRYSSHGCRCDDCKAASAADHRARRHDPDCGCVVCILAAAARVAEVGITADEYHCDEVRALDGRRRTPPKLAVAPEPPPTPRSMTSNPGATLDEDHIDAVLTVARAHGTNVAAEWGNVTTHLVVKLRQTRDGYFRGAGHPTKAEIAARAPRLSCPCPRCVEWRADTETTTAEGAASEGWFAEAACRGRRKEIFFPTRGETTAPAKTICAGCPVRAECLDYALANHEHHGIWGGTSEQERRNMRRRRGAA